MKVASDVYAELNPAFCAAVVASFARAYSAVADHGPDLALAYVAVPLALSAQVGLTFSGTNKNTGLREWIERHPEVQVQIAPRINSAIPFVTEAVQFGCFCKAFELDDRAQLARASAPLKESALRRLSDDVGDAIKRAERLGYWCAGAGSPRAVFDILGLTV